MSEDIRKDDIKLENLKNLICQTIEIAKEEYEKRNLIQYFDNAHVGEISGFMSVGRNTKTLRNIAVEMRMAFKDGLVDCDNLTKERLLVGLKFAESYYNQNIDKLEIEIKNGRKIPNLDYGPVSDQEYDILVNAEREIAECFENRQRQRDEIDSRKDSAGYPVKNYSSQEWYIVKNFIEENFNKGDIEYVRPDEVIDRMPSLIELQTNFDKILKDNDGNVSGEDINNLLSDDHVM